MLFRLKLTSSSLWFPKEVPGFEPLDLGLIMSGGKFPGAQKQCWPEVNHAGPGVPRRKMWCAVHGHEGKQGRSGRQISLRVGALGG